jgi:S1-C subfamily serine protease
MGVGVLTGCFPILQSVERIEEGKRLPCLGFTATPSKSPRGLQITELQPGGPLTSSRIQIGDTLEQINGRVLSTNTDYEAAISGLKPGQVVNVRYTRVQFLGLKVEVFTGQAVLGYKGQNAVFCNPVAAG